MGGSFCPTSCSSGPLIEAHNTQCCAPGLHAVIGTVSRLRLPQPDLRSASSCFRPAVGQNRLVLQGRLSVCKSKKEQECRPQLGSEPHSPIRFHAKAQSLGPLSCLTTPLNPPHPSKPFQSPLLGCFSFLRSTFHPVAFLRFFCKNLSIHFQMTF